MLRKAVHKAAATLRKPADRREVITVAVSGILSLFRGVVPLCLHDYVAGACRPLTRAEVEEYG